jgi:hypothetical protein
MIYFTTKDGQAIAIVEPGNLDQMRSGEPLVTPDRKFMMAYVPDMRWFHTRFQKMVHESQGVIDAEALDALLKEALKQHVIRR